MGLPEGNNIAVSLALLVATAILILIGIVILAVIIGTLIHFLPAAIIAVVVWLLFGSLFWGGVAFLAAAVLMIIFKH